MAPKPLPSPPEPCPGRVPAARQAPVKVGSSGPSTEPEPSGSDCPWAEAGGRASRRKTESGRTEVGRKGATPTICLSSGSCGGARLTRTAEGPHVPAPELNAFPDPACGQELGEAEERAPRPPAASDPPVGLPLTELEAPGTPLQVDPDSLGPEFRVHTCKPPVASNGLGPAPKPPGHLMAGPVMRALAPGRAQKGREAAIKNFPGHLCPKLPQMAVPRPPATGCPHLPGCQDLPGRLCCECPRRRGEPTFCCGLSSLWRPRAPPWESEGLGVGGVSPQGLGARWQQHPAPDLGLRRSPAPPGGPVPSPGPETVGRTGGGVPWCRSTALGRPDPRKASGENS